MLCKVRLACNVCVTCFMDAIQFLLPLNIEVISDFNNRHVYHHDYFYLSRELNKPLYFLQLEQLKVLHEIKLFCGDDVVVLWEFGQLHGLLFVSTRKRSLILFLVTLFPFFSSWIFSEGWPEQPKKYEYSFTSLPTSFGALFVVLKMVHLNENMKCVYAMSIVISINSYVDGLLVTKFQLLCFFSS